MKKMLVVLAILFFSPIVFASQQNDTNRSALSGIAYLEGRGFSNALLFITEWPMLAQQEYHDHPKAFAATLPFVATTHTVGRIFSGLTDIVFLPLAYPFSRYDDSIPMGYGWGEFPWQEGVER